MLIHDFYLTDHAIEEMQRRDITIDSIRACLAKPDQIIKSTISRFIYQSKITILSKAYLLRIIVDSEVVPNRVITAYKTSKIEKYWETK